MPRRRGPGRRGGDAYHQLPIVDLVSQTDPVAQAAECELQELGQLLEFSAALTTELLDRSRDLAAAIHVLEASGLCPDSLRRDSRAYFFALGLHLLSGSTSSTLCPCNTSTSTSRGKNMDMTSPPPVADDFCTKSDVITYLESIGFNDVGRVIAKYGLQKVKEAIAYACSQPPDKVQNIGAYIRAVLRDTILPSRRRQDPDRYVKGRYGHVVNR